MEATRSKGQLVWIPRRRHNIFQATRATRLWPYANRARAVAGCLTEKKAIAASGNVKRTARSHRRITAAPNHAPAMAQLQPTATSTCANGSARGKQSSAIRDDTRIEETTRTDTTQ